MSALFSRLSAMSQLSRTVILNEFVVAVEIESGTTRAKISITRPGAKRLPFFMSIEPYLNAGLTEQEALDHLIEISSDSITNVVEEAKRFPRL